MKIACLGSSITQHANVWNAAQFEYAARGYMTWVQALTEWRLEHVGWSDADGNRQGLNFGVSGEETNKILDRVDQVIAANVDACIVQAGTNDIPGDIDVIKDKTRHIFDALRQAGIAVIALGVLPRSTSVWEAGSQARKQRNDLNRWKRQYADEHEGVYYVDPDKYLVDPASTDSELLTGMLRDGTHTYPKGAYNVARPIAELLNSLYEPRDPFVTTGEDLYDSDDNPRGNHFPNPSFTGTGGNAQTGITGSVPDSWDAVATTGSPTATASVETRSDQAGNWLKLDISGGGNSEEEIQIDPSAGVSLPVGKWYVMECEVKRASWAGWLRPRFELKDESDPFYSRDMAGENTDVWPTDAETMRLKTPPVKVTGDGSVRTRLEISLDGTESGSGIIRIGGMALYEIDPPSEFVDRETVPLFDRQQIRRSPKHRQVG